MTETRGKADHWLALESPNTAAPGGAGSRAWV